MTLLATQSLWQAIYDKLNNDSILMAEVSGIFDPAPEGQNLPYITIGEGSSYDWSAKDFAGQEHIIDVHIWSGQKGGGQIRILADKVADLLAGQDLTLMGHQLIELKFIFFENFFDENGDIRHGILRFRGSSIQN